MIRLAVQEDAAAIERFLAAHAETSMFLRGNLAQHGTDERSHRHGTRFYLHDTANGITGVTGLTNGGFLMCQAPHSEADFFDAVAAAIGGRKIAGMTGDPPQVTALLSALGCNAGPFSLREIDPLYALDLAQLAVSDPAGSHIRPPTRSDAAWLVDWFYGFKADTGLAELSPADAAAEAEVFLDKPDSRLLVVQGVPVAMSAVNARAGETVQIGGVYVPPSKRGNGYGGEVVRQQLTDLRAQGVRKAILFAANDHAARAYQGIGFQPVGSYELALLKDPYEVPA